MKDELLKRIRYIKLSCGYHSRYSGLCDMCYERKQMKMKIVEIIRSIK